MSDTASTNRRPAGRAGKTMIGAYVDQDALFTLQELLLKISRQRKAKVTMQDAIIEAMNDFAKKHGLNIKLD